LVRSIERGRVRVLKAISRSVICIQELIDIKSELKAGDLHIRDVVNFRNPEEISEEGIQDCLESTLERLDKIEEARRKLGRTIGQSSARSKRSRQPERLRGKIARTRIELSWKVRGLDLTQQVQDRLIGIIRKAATESNEIKLQRQELVDQSMGCRTEWARRVVRGKIGHATRRLSTLEHRLNATTAQLDRAVALIAAGERNRPRHANSS